MEVVLKPPVFPNEPCKERGGEEKEEEHTRSSFSESLIVKSRVNVFPLRPSFS